MEFSTKTSGRGSTVESILKTKRNDSDSWLGMESVKVNFGAMFKKNKILR